VCEALTVVPVTDFDRNSIDSSVPANSIANAPATTDYLLEHQKVFGRGRSVSDRVCWHARIDGVSVEVCYGHNSQCLADFDRASKHGAGDKRLYHNYKR